MPAPVRIALAADERYAPYSAAMLHSLFVHGSTGPSVHYLHPPGYPPAVMERFLRLADRHGASLRFHEIPDRDVEGLPAMRSIERIVWYRALLPDLLPDVDRILYLDADTLVMDRLDELWNTDFGGAHVAAVRNVTEPGFRAHLAELALAPGAAYFNSGVLMMDLDRWRRDRCTAHLLAVARAAGARYRWGDQDALNVLFASSCRLLHPRWNCQNSIFFWPEWSAEVFGAQFCHEATSHPAILHFEGPGMRKPWHYLCEHPFRNQYRRHLRRTGLPVPRLEGLTVENVLHKYTEWLRAPLRVVRGLLRSTRPGSLP